MSRPRYEVMLRYRLFRNWWARTLKKRPHKLIDISTREDMDINKQIFVQMPKLEDLCEFIEYIKFEQADLSFNILKQNWRCELFRSKPQVRVVRSGLTPKMAVEVALIEFLKTKI